MAAESTSSSAGYTLQQWLALQEGKRTRIEDALPENSTRWMEKYYADRDGASSWHSDTFGAQPSYGPAVWQFGEERGGLLVEVNNQKINNERKKKAYQEHRLFLVEFVIPAILYPHFRVDNDV